MIKYGIIDVRAKINDKDSVDIEIQIAQQSNIIERILFYWSKMYAKQIQRGDDYTVLNRCISVIFLEYGIAHLKELPIHTEWQILERKNVKIVLIAGPSSSGKTTTSNLIRQSLEQNGIKSITISLDDFFLNRDKTPRLPNGSPDQWMRFP